MLFKYVLHHDSIRLWIQSSPILQVYNTWRFQAVPNLSVDGARRCLTWSNEKRCFQRWFDNLIFMYRSFREIGRFLPRPFILLRQRTSKFNDQYNLSLKRVHRPQRLDSSNKGTSCIFFSKKSLNGKNTNSNQRSYWFHCWEAYIFVH